MFFELVNSGITYYGKNNQKIPIKKVPLWEGIRLLTFKGNPFLSSFSKKGYSKEFHYYYSKLLLGIGEALLLLDQTYVADNFKRYDLVMGNRFSQKIPGFIVEYQKAHKFRYFNYTFKEKNNLIKEKGINFLKHSWNIYLNHYFSTNPLRIKNLLQKVRPLTIKEKIGTRIIYTFNYFKMFKKIRFCFFSEPFIKEIVMIQKYLNSKGDKLRKEIVMSWKASPRFWYPR